MSHSTENADVPPTRRPWRVAFCITELDPGGAERQFATLVRGIDRTRFTPEVVCLSGQGELATAIEDAGVPVTFLHACGRWDVAVVDRLRRHFRRSRPDLVQTFLFHANLAGRVAARLVGVPVVVSGIRVAEPRRWQLWCDRLTDRLVDRHVCVSDAVARHAAEVGRLPGAKLVVIPNAVDAARFAAAVPADLTEFGISTGEKVILFVGRLDEQKNPALLLDAFRSVRKDVPEARLLFVGEGPLLSELQRSAMDLGGAVVFAGMRRDVPRLMRAATCLASPSRWEGMPNVVLEAMAAGLPVVATPAEGVSELLRGGELGSIVSDATPAAFAEALVRALRKHEMVSETAVEAQGVVFEDFTEQALVARYQELFQGLLSGTANPRSAELCRASARADGKI